MYQRIHIDQMEDIIWFGMLSGGYPAAQKISSGGGGREFSSITHNPYFEDIIFFHLEHGFHE